MEVDIFFNHPPLKASSYAPVTENLIVVTHPLQSGQHTPLDANPLTPYLSPVPSNGSWSMMNRRVVYVLDQVMFLTLFVVMMGLAILAGVAVLSKILSIFH